MTLHFWVTCLETQNKPIYWYDRWFFVWRLLHQRNGGLISELTSAYCNTYFDNRCKCDINNYKIINSEVVSIRSVFDRKVFQQTVGIPMLLLYSYEADFIRILLWMGKKQLASWFNLTSPFGTCICSNVETILFWTCHVYGPFEFRTSLGTSIFAYRYIDDVLSINNPEFENYLGKMYPAELEKPQRSPLLLRT